MISLASKLQRVKAKLLGTAAVDIPVPFEMKCSCGQKLSGIRRTTAQQISCDECGEARFVLPVNVYPTTRRVQSEVVSGSLSNRLAAAARELVPASEPQHDDSNGSSDNSTSASASVAAEQDSSNNPSRRRSRGNASANNGDEKTAAEKKTPILPQIDVKRVARRTFTPFRMIMLGVVVIVLGTGWWTVQQRRLSRARQDLRNSVDAVETAMAESNFNELLGPLQTATLAAEVLGKRDSEAGSILNLLYQTVAVNEVSSIDLVAELDRAYLKSGQLDETRVRDLKRAITLGVQFFECPIIKSPLNKNRIQLLLPLKIHSDRVRIESHSTLLNYAATQLKGTSLIFAARVESCEAPSAEGGEWIIELSPDGCALLTSELHCIELGLDPDAEPLLRQQLSQQEAFIESVDLFQLAELDRILKEQQLVLKEEAEK